MSKFPPLNTIPLYHSSLGALEQPGEVNITPQLGSRTTRHSRTPTQKRAHFYPLTPTFVYPLTPTFVFLTADG